MSKPTQRVVITGLGVVCPLGRDLETLWSNLSQKKSGITELKCLPKDGLDIQFGGEAKCFTGDIGDFGPLEKSLQRAIKKNQKVMCREIEMGVAACQMALAHSGLAAPELRNPERTGIVFGSDYILTRPEEFADGVTACFDADKHFDMKKWPTVGRPKVNPLWLLKYLPNMPASHVAIYNDLRGPSNSVTIREASSSASITEAVATIRRGAADVMLAGATGSRLEPLRALHFAVSEKLARSRDNPAHMSRPFDLHRDGTVLGEGSGALVLESLEHAVARGAKIWGEIVAGVGSCVGHQRQNPRDFIRLATKNVLSGLMQRAQDIGLPLTPGAWHIHACGRSEIDADRSEALGIFDCVGNKDVAVTAAKSYFGNLGAGCATVEIVASCLALEKQSMFSTLNCDAPDPTCPINVTNPGSPGEAFVNLAFSSQGQASGVLIRRLLSA
ncbi:MAG: beta-ketoacyl synthase N-terminal-like domain-containing protein [Pirellula sp.]